MLKRRRSTNEGGPTVRYRYATNPRATKRKRPLSKGATALLVLFVVAGLAFAAGWNPPTTTVHSFTDASDYNAERDSGCTNSGDGCHGFESSYADFNVYHPDTGCTTCHDYQGVGCIPCHEPANNECVTCHDGTMPNAPDCVRLTEPYPRGHYRETTHTAMGTDMATVVRTANDGEAGLECGDCHSRDMREAHTGAPSAEGSEYGDDVNCGECHNDTRCFGLEQVSSDWEDRRCEDCHTEDSSAPMHSPDIATSIEPSGTPGCGATGKGCHETDDVHALHPNLPKDCSGSAKDGEPGCHDTEVESHKPTATACGGEGDGTCHLAYEPDELTHKNDAALHSAETRYPASDTSFYGVPCGDCHFMEPDGISLVTEHDVWTSQKTVVADDGCRNCHNHLASQEAIENDWELRNTRESCDACHGTYRLGVPHAPDVASLHLVYVGSEGCADTGPGCHPTADLFSVGEPTTTEGIHRDCLRCHDKNASGGNGSYYPGRNTCGSNRGCHSAPGAYDPDTSKHFGAGKSRTDGRDAAHHTAGEEQGSDVLADSASGLKVACDVCHDMRLAPEHGRPNSSMSTPVCFACHNYSVAVATVVKTDWPGRWTDGACDACHDQSGMDLPHTRVADVHEATEISRFGEPEVGACAEPGCHSAIDVRVVHKNVGCAIEGCHGTDGDIFGDRTMSCGGPDGTEGSCHTSSERHYHMEESHFATEINRYGEPEVGSCAEPGCHPTNYTRDLHTTYRCSTPGCHVEGGPTYMTCGGPDGTAESCHTSSERHYHMTESHLATEINRFGVPEVGACAEPGCHPTNYTRDLHTTYRCSTPGCHVEGGPTYNSCGGPDGTENSCHTSSERHYHMEESHLATEINRFGVPEVGACAEPGCHPTNNARDLHTTYRCSTPGCHEEGGPTYMTCGGPDGTAESCHTSSERHYHMDESHLATEYAGDGTARPDYCVQSGCHTTNYTRDLHTTYRCSTAGCHEEGGPTYNSCGGAEGQDNCHIGYGPDEHFVSHAADLTGTVEGVPYDVGTNIGCFGACHSTDLVTEHADQLVAGLDGGGDTSCSVCHYNEDDPGVGDYAGLPAVTSAIAGHDRRCVSCHASGSSTDGPDAVASPPAGCEPAVPAPASVEPNVTVEPQRLNQVVPSADSSGSVGVVKNAQPSQEETIVDQPATDEPEGASDEASATGGPKAEEGAEQSAEDAADEPGDEPQEAGGECPGTDSGESGDEVSETVSTGGRDEVCLGCHELRTEEAVY